MAVAPDGGVQGPTACYRMGTALRWLWHRDLPTIPIDCWLAARRREVEVCDEDQGQRLRGAVGRDGRGGRDLALCCLSGRCGTRTRADDIRSRDSARRAIVPQVFLEDVGDMSVDVLPSLVRGSAGLPPFSSQQLIVDALGQDGHRYGPRTARYALTWARWKDAPSGVVPARARRRHGSCGRIAIPRQTSRCSGVPGSLTRGFGVEV